MPRADAKEESLSIPTSVRNEVDERDGMHCRMCGRHLGDRRCLHHIIYGGDDRGMGGRRVHNVDEIVTLCWLPGDGQCHDRAHSNKGLWQPLLLEVCKTNGVTAFQLLRWRRRQTQGPRAVLRAVPRNTGQGEQ